MPPWLTTRVKVLVVLTALALALFLWDSQQPRAPRPQTAGSGSSEPVEGRLLQLPPALQQLLATETKPAPKPILSAEARRALEERSRRPWGRDPFALEAARPKGQAEVRPSFAANLHVTGIIWDSTRMHAVINDSLVKVGDEVEGVRVVAIERDRVTVAKGDQRQILRLGE